MRASGKIAAGISAAAVMAAMLAAALGITVAAQAAGGYPQRPVMLIVPYGAGGVADVGMRILGEKLSTRLKQQFVIENRPGAGGIAAAEAGASAAPDGYTLLMTGNNSAIAEALFAKLPYNILTDFSSVSTAAFFDLLILTRPGSPLKSLKDVIAAAKANPGKLNIGTIVPGSTQNLAAELFTSTAGIKATIVTFRTSADMANALMRGDIDLEFEFYAAVNGLLASNKLVPLASTGAKRTAYLPDVPTAIESGIKNYEVVSWNGLAVPAKTPAAVVATLNEAMKDVIPDPDIQNKAKAMGMEMRWSTPADMTARMKADIAKWSAVIAAAGIPKRD
ncbi:MAG TPA: tripartite tricarboxylate transporter substrate-binding protein [Xanthobacteraceae bacterium]|nr:tripartite tricarboxylate transporter substrate-binding protein [Xanthobacteraceae bacterium]